MLTHAVSSSLISPRARYKLAGGVLGIVLCCLVSSCIRRTNSPPPPAVATPEARGTSTAPAATLPPGSSIAKKYAEYFTVGVAVGQKHLDAPKVRDVITTHFNRLTAENAWKFGSLSSKEGQYDWAEADTIAKFAREHNMPMTGHTLVWHRQAPGWLFADLRANDPSSVEKLKQRMQHHISTMVQRYADVTDNWDVVNEAISDDSSKDFRDASEGSQFYGTFGNADYVYWAFVYAEQALEAQAAGSAEGKLYYNDYNVNLKLDRILALADSVRQRGARVDGIGMQMHIRLDWPSIDELDQTIQRIVAAGYQVKVSELDVSLYNDYPGGKFKAAPAVDFTPELAQLQAQRYRDLFALFRKHAEHITSVTLWGVSDDATWLDQEPVSGRNNHPLLFDDEQRPKAAAAAILDF